MATVRRLKGRNVNGVVEINAEVLFAEGAMVSRWKSRLTQRVRARAAEYAPSNKRPRWAHYGEPLKATMRATTMTRMTKGGGFAYSGVGSTAPYALYVDQGTNSFYAKILPPTAEGAPNLFEHTWRSQGGVPNGRILVSGQEGKKFFERALRASMQSMANRSVQVPSEGVTGISPLAVAATEMFFSGATPVDAGFRASLDEWRRWRDAAHNRGLPFREGGSYDQKERARQRRADQKAANKRRRMEKSKERSKEWRKRQKNDRMSQEEWKAERKKITNWLRENFRQRGFFVSEIHIERDGTWTASIRKSSLDNWKRVAGRW